MVIEIQKWLKPPPIPIPSRRLTARRLQITSLSESNSQVSQLVSQAGSQSDSQKTKTNGWMMEFGSSSFRVFFNLK